MSIGRIVRSADFERVLGHRSRVSSSHFAVHHLLAQPSQPTKPAPLLSTAECKLSTADAQVIYKLVDEPLVKEAWLGVVVPKRHAKRAVTRTLLKRQIRAAFQEAGSLPAGLWVVRLRLAFDRKLFPSASSEALKAAAGNELSQLLVRVLAHSAPVNAANSSLVRN